MNESIRHQDDGGDLALFVDGLFMRLMTSEDMKRWETGDLTANAGGLLGGSVEVLKTCANHPRVAAVDCTTCVPLDDG
ncbi:hypothetical protein [Frankia sp. AgW1.1]|uniref:hypothetical protein n=1 Tax=Frankia sp. AgW1.1 TaxID=1836971 RepID=UPI0019315193|nr:hypothetical protein [Frankia sp. AgW1.1]MBL7487044.1 hypothetical protein [Frankia sp. AgW1.1]